MDAPAAQRSSPPSIRPCTISLFALLLSSQIRRDLTNTHCSGVKCGHGLKLAARRHGRVKTANGIKAKRRVRACARARACACVNGTLPSLPW